MKSLLAMQLENFASSPNNAFIEYAKFDGKVKNNFSCCKYRNYCSLTNARGLCVMIRRYESNHLTGYHMFSWGIAILEHILQRSSHKSSGGKGCIFAVETFVTVVFPRPPL